MFTEHAGAHFAALQDFVEARRRGALEQVLDRFRGKSVDLLSYDDVRHKVKAHERGPERLEDVAVDAIVGSVGRYADFTRTFLPKETVDPDRWARVQRAMTGPSGVPPVVLHKIGDAYFVVDGNHRVSVARQLGFEQIEAFVTELHPRVPLDPGDRPEDLVVKAEYAQFLEDTGLDESRPGADLAVTEPGRYGRLAEHVQVHRYYMGLEQKRDISFGEAAAHWYDDVYEPIARVIRRLGLLRDFPERTETDLYLWLAEHRAALGETLDMDVAPESAAADLAVRHSRRAGRVAARVGEALRDTLVPDELEAGPAPGEWRETRLQARNGSADVPGTARLFADALVAVSGTPAGWCAFDAALQLAAREGTRLHGLHVVSSAGEVDSDAARAVRAEYERRLEEAGVPGRLVVATGEVSRAICRRASLVDLVVLSLSFPPGAGPLARLSSGFRTVLLRCPRPVLAVPSGSDCLMVGEGPGRAAVLAYDDSRKAREALYVATYLAIRWALSLAVVTVAADEDAAAALQAPAREYLEEHGVEAAYVVEGGYGAAAAHGTPILDAARARDAELIVLGGYGRSPLVEAALGSTVDAVLRGARRPVLISR